MTFARPALLALAFVAFAALVALVRYAERRRTIQALTYSNVAFALDALRPPRWPGVLLAGAFFTGAFALLAAPAGPRFEARVPSRDANVVLCIDTSGSMRARDVVPSRAAAAKAAARAFLDAVPAGTRVGIVSFASAALAVVPPTDDLDAVRDALDRIPPPDGGTAIGEALALAAEQLPARGRRIVVLMTDGVYNVGRDPLEASHELGARGITIETVGIGTSGSGQFVPGTADLADLDAGALRAIAANGNGRYAEAADARGLAEAFRTIALGTVWETKRVDGSLPFAFSGGLLVIVAFVAGLASGRVP